MNVEIGNDAAKFPEKEYINGIFLAVQFVNKKFQRQNFLYIACYALSLVILRIQSEILFWKP
jgi:hypothetical protein